MFRTPVMPAALVVGALVVHILGTKLFSTPKGCYDNLEECIAEHNLCRREGNSLESMCGIKGELCQLEDTEVCNMTIQILFSGISLRRGCIWQWEEEPCIFLHLLVANCQQHLGYEKSSAKMSWMPQELNQKSAPASVSCVRALQSCKESHNCSSAYESMKALCPMDGTDCGVASPLCLSLWEELNRSPLGKCTCNQAEQKTVPKMKWSDSGLSGYVPGMSLSCSGQMNACLQSEACNKWLRPMVQACPAGQCNQSLCGLGIQQFYEGLPQTMAEMLVFCTCDPEDWTCQVARASLHGGTCEPELDWTCLEMMDSCLESSMCRDRFGSILSKCLGKELADTDSYVLQWVDLMDYNLIHSQDRECRMALVASMGTTLQQPCNCDGLHTGYLHKCHLLHQLLHNKTIFSNHLAITRAPDQSLKPNEGVHKQWWLADDVLYISMYIILVVAVLGVVITVCLLKLGMQKKATDQHRYDSPSQKDSGTDVHRCHY